MSNFARWATLFVLTSSAACGSSDIGPTGAGATGGATPGDGGHCGGSPEGGSAEDTDAALPDSGDCAPAVESHPIEGAQHLPICSPTPYNTNPPSSGNHYAVWADYRTYERTFPRGFWVHSLEHGAVVITYNCPQGCAAEVADAQALIGTLTDAACGAAARRVILLPDPELDVRFAASAWGFTLRTNCFDSAAFTSFFSDHFDHAPESICGGGTDPTDVCGPSSCP